MVDLHFFSLSIRVYIQPATVQLAFTLLSRVKDKQESKASFLGSESTCNRVVVLLLLIALQRPSTDKQLVLQLPQSVSFFISDHLIKSFIREPFKSVPAEG